MQRAYVFLQVLAVFRNRHLINAGGGVFSQLVKGFRQEVPAGSLVAPDRYLGLTRCVSCSTWLAPSSARSPSASNGKRQGVGFAGHPCSGSSSQGDGRLSRVPGLPL